MLSQVEMLKAQLEAVTDDARKGVALHRARIAELERSLALADRQVDNMAAVLREVHEAIHSGGGVRLVDAAAKIDAVLPPASDLH